MALAAYQDLCIDACQPQDAARFWAAALGLTIAEDRGAVIRLDGPRRRDRVWINRVPEPAPTHNRLHLDVHVRAVADLVDLGAVVRDDSLPWTVLTDPDGGDLCAFVRAQPPPLRLYELVLDALDPEATARWWATLLGGRAASADGGAWAVGDVPGAPFEWLCVNPTAEPKTAKNRVHVDVTTPDVAALRRHGARVLRERGGDIGWDVLADPEGNEFCAFPSHPAAP